MNPPIQGLKKLSTAIKLLSTQIGRATFIARLRCYYFQFYLKKRHPDFIPLTAFNGTRWLLPTHNAGTEWFYTRPDFDRTGMEECLSLIHEGDTVLDVGANHGYYSALLADHLNGTGAVYAIEAFPDTATILKKQLEDRTNCKIIQSPIWSCITEINLDFDPSIPDAQRSVSTTGTSSIKSKTLDQIWTEIGKPRISLIKMDVEGCELEVLKGGNQLWQSPDPPWLYIEVNPDTLARFNTTSEELVSHLEYLGYDLNLPGESRRGGSRIVELSKIRGYVNAFGRPPRGRFRSRK